MKKQRTLILLMLLTVFFSACGGSYTNEIPINKEEVVVTVTDKVNLPENLDAERYSDRVEFEFNLSNMTDKDIKGIQGILTTKDMFGADIISFNCDFTGNTLLAGGSLNVADLGMDINEFMDDHIKLYNEEYSDLIFEYEVTSIVYIDGTTE